jgi:hypothetical protein
MVIPSFFIVGAPRSGTSSLYTYLSAQPRVFISSVPKEPHSCCIPPLAPQYTTLPKYAEHVVRYQEAFGPDRVKCILFAELRDEPQRVYAETRAFLGLDPAGSPDFRAHNPRLRWRNQRAARAMMVPYRHRLRFGFALSNRLLRNAVPFSLALLFALPGKAITTTAAPKPLPPGRRGRFGNGSRRTWSSSQVLGRGRSGWLGPD